MSKVEYENNEKTYEDILDIERAIQDIQTAGDKVLKLVVEKVGQNGDADATWNSNETQDLTQLINQTADFLNSLDSYSSDIRSAYEKMKNK